MEPKYKLTIIVPEGLFILDRPTATARRMRAVQVGGKLEAAQIFTIDGVPYAELIPVNSEKPEFCRISEGGGLAVDDNGHTRRIRGVKTFATVEDLFPEEDSYSQIDLLLRIAKALEKIADK